MTQINSFDNLGQFGPDALHPLETTEMFFLTILVTVYYKGAGLFQSARQTKEQAGGRGTSRYPNGIKS